MKPVTSAKKQKKAKLKVENPSTPKDPGTAVLCNPSWTDI
jgi:hypothetical protein